MKKILIAFFCCLSITNAYAGEFSYECTAISAADVNEKGEVRNRKDMLTKKSTFMVDRASGTIVGAPFGNAGSARANITVLDFGSKQQAYKVLTVYKPYTTIDFLQINEFEEKPEKPFFGISFGTFITGICL